MILLNKLHTFGVTNTGKVRENNEDNFKICSKTNFLLVSDGVGGHDDGEVASQFVVDTLPKTIKHQKGNPSSVLDYAVRTTNQLLITLNREKMSDMAATATGMWFPSEDEINSPYIFNVGDSRVYTFNKKTLTLTQHTTDQAIKHRLLQSMGYSVKKTDVQQLELSNDDVILICSDGLTNMVNEIELTDILFQVDKNNLEEVANQLVETANEKGGYDNITVVLATF